MRHAALAAGANRGIVRLAALPDGGAGFGFLRDRPRVAW